MTNFRSKTIQQIRLWAWAAAVLPVTALAGIFFVWNFGTNSWVSIAMVIGETVMFSIAVVWWWWAMYILKTLVRQWDDTKERVGDVLNDVKEIRNIVLEVLEKDK